MTFIAALPVIGLLFFTYSLLELIRKTPVFPKSLVLAWLPAWQSEISQSSRHSRLVLSLAVGVLLIHFVSTYGASWLRILWGLGVIGLALLFYVEWRKRGGLGSIIFSVFLCLPFGAIFHFFGPSTALNFDDDLAKYLILPIGLIETGGLDFGPLGPQMGGASILTAGLQGLYILGIEISWIAHWDIAISLSFIAVSIAVSGKDLVRMGYKTWLAGTSSIFCLLLVNVMYVNISAIYLPATIFAVVGSLLVVTRRRSFLEALGIGGISAALFLFKFNYILLSVALMLAYYFLVFFSPSLNFKEKAVLFATSLSTFCSVAPNLVSSFVSALGKIFTLVIGSSEIGALGRGAGYLSGNSPSPLRPFDTMFSLEPAFYGYGVDSYFSINFFVALVSLISIGGFFLVIIDRSVANWRLEQGAKVVLLMGILSSLILGAEYYLFYRNMGAIDANIRYMMPSVLGLVLFGVFAWWIIPSGRRLSVNISLICVVVAFLGSQVASGGHRLHQVLKYGNLLAFPAAREEFMAAQTEFVVGGKGLRFASELQSLVPNGATILVVVGFPSLLDFRRNRILLAEADGKLERFDDAGQFLQDHSVDFIFWQTRGLGVKTVAQWVAWGNSSPARGRFARERIAFLQKLESLSARCDTFSPIDEIIIFPVSSCSFAKE